MVGSNGAIRMLGNATADRVHLFTPTATCTGNGCTPEKLIGHRDPYPLPVDFIRQDMDRLCGAGPTGSLKVTADVTLDGGTYCASEVVITGGNLYVNATETNPVTIYLTGDLTVANGLMVNCTPASCTSSGPNMSLPPRPGTLRFFVLGSRVAFGNHTTVAAAIYAPQASCEGNPSNAQSTVYGSLVCNDLSNQGSTDYWYDDTLLDTSDTPLVVDDWREEYVR
jgi:hypothetical protein